MDSDILAKIQKENDRLRRRYRNLPEDTLDILDGLIDRAAFMRVQLADMEMDILQNGRVEMFSQSDKVDPYEKERPVVKQYTALSRNYQSISKQLDDKLPKADPVDKDDGFDSFVVARED